MLTAFLEELSSCLKQHIHYTHASKCTTPIHTLPLALYTRIPIHLNAHAHTLLCPPQDTCAHTLPCPPAGPDYSASTNAHPWFLVKTTKEEEALAQGGAPSFSLWENSSFLAETQIEATPWCLWQQLLSACLEQTTHFLISVSFTVLSIFHDNHKWIDGFLKVKVQWNFQVLVLFWPHEWAATTSPGQGLAWLLTPHGRHSFPGFVSSSSSGMRNSKS